MAVYEECQEAHAHWLRAEGAKARSRAEYESYLPPHQRFYEREAEAAMQSAATSLKAHRMSKCSCVLRDLLNRQKNRQNSSLNSEE